MTSSACSTNQSVTQRAPALVESKNALLHHHDIIFEQIEVLSRSCPLIYAVVKLFVACRSLLSDVPDDRILFWATRQKV